MKKYAKSIVTSLLMAVAFGAMTVGTTFALFTSQAKTSIEVEAGKVEVLQTAQIMSVKELGSVDVIPVNGVYTNSIGGKTYIDSQNNGIIRLENWAPGDKAVIKITNTNNSNVTIKTRFAVAHSTTSNPDLFNALRLNYDVKDANDQDIGYKFMDWTAVEPTVTKISDVTVTVEFPDGDNGEILFGDANHDNQYQNCNCAIAFSQQAVQGNAATDSILDQLNAALDSAATLNGRNKTMHDALADVSSLISESLVKTAGYVWNATDDHFYYGQENTTNAFFRIYDEMPLAQTNSIYASSDWETATVDLTGVGFDAGNASGITAINYVGAGVARTNVVRTNGGTLTINAPLDKVQHYGFADTLDIIAVAPTSYHENGKIGYAKIATGRLVVEKTADMDGIYLVANNDGEFDGIKLAVVGDATLPTLARADVALADGESKLVVEVQTLEESDDVDENPEYVWISKSGVDVESVVSASDNPTDYEENIVAEPTEAAGSAKEDTASATDPIDENSVARIKVIGYDSFAAAFAAVKNDETIVMLKNVSLTSANTLSKSITLDLNGNTIATTAILFNIYSSNINLTIKDSGNTGAINATGAGKIVYSSGNGNNIVLEGGALSISGTSSFTYGISLSSGSNFTMTGGSITIPEASTSTYNYCVSNTGSGTITISGGTLLGKATGGNYVISNSSSGNVYISGGHFEGYYAAWSYTPYVLYNTGSGTTYVSGGYFRAVGSKSLVLAGHLLEGTASISGGYFGGVYYYSLPSSAIAEGYQCIGNTDTATKANYQYVVVPAE